MTPQMHADDSLPSIKRTGNEGFSMDHLPTAEHNQRNGHPGSNDAALLASPEHRLGMAINTAFATLDEIMALAAFSETKDLVLLERVALHQLCSRAQLIASFVDAALDQPGKVRMVVNNG